MTDKLKLKGRELHKHAPYSSALCSAGNMIKIYIKTEFINAISTKPTLVSRYKIVVTGADT